MPLSDRKSVGTRDAWLVRAVVNANAGAASTPGQAEEIAKRLDAACTARGWRIQTEVVPGAQLEAALIAAMDASPDALVVGGGDGTIRAALERVIGTSAALGLIPMGTMNFVAKDLGIPLTPLDAAGSLATAEVREVDVGEVNGRRFFHSSAIGIVPTLAEKRERIREASSVRERLASIWEALRTAAGAQPLSIVLEHTGGRERERTLSLIVSNNPLSSDPLTPYRRHVLDGGELSAYIARHRGRLGIVRMLVTFGSGWWFWDRAIVEVRAATLKVVARRKRISVSNDGEVEVLRLPLRYKVLTRAVRVLAPPLAPPLVPAVAQPPAVSGGPAKGDEGRGPEENAKG